MGAKPDSLVIAKAKSEIGIIPKMANRHGLIAGATGTGKTVTLRTLAEQFSADRRPRFSWLTSRETSPAFLFRAAKTPRSKERIQKLGLEDFRFQGFPVAFWDVFGEQGHPVRTTVSEMGPLLFSRILTLNEIQSGVLTLVFKIADDNGLLLLDLKDLRSMLQFVGDQAEQFKTEYGNISAASIGAIQRGLLNLEEQGGDKFFGEPALNLQDLMQTDARGKGSHQHPRRRSADAISEALCHLSALDAGRTLRDSFPKWETRKNRSWCSSSTRPTCSSTMRPKVLVEKIEQVVRLIRSKGVGVYFITQNPLDLPETVLGQLGNRVQHALRAFTPRDQKTVKAAAETFRANPKLNVAKAITELEVGEALVSVLDEKGAPTKVERAYICPPHSRLTPLTPDERSKIIKESVVYGHYEKTVDRESAYEKLKVRAEQEKEASRSPETRSAEPRSQAGDLLTAAAKSAAHAIGSQIGRQIIRGVLGSLFGGGRR